MVKPAQTTTPKKHKNDNNVKETMGNISQQYLDHR